MSCKESSNPILRLEGVSKSFGGLKAITNITFGMDLGRITALVGPNGAGKTTVFNVTTGFVTPDSGRIILDGQRIDHLQSHVIARMGIARTFQNPRVISYLTVKENLLAAIPHLPGEQWWDALFNFKRRSDIQKALETCERFLDLTNMARQRDLLGKELNFGEQRIVNVLQSILSGAHVILVDEPTVGLDSIMQDRLASLLRQTVEDYKNGILLVEHNMEFVMKVADYVLLLVEGEVVLDGTPDEIKANEIFHRLYIGV